MEKRPLGRTGIDVTSLCLGTMMYGEQIGEELAFEQMDASLDFGINFFDTAEMYTIPPKAETQGESERIVGRWMKERSARDKIVLTTKVMGQSGFDYMRPWDGIPRLRRKDIEFAVDRSLENLQTDYIDLYQTHWPDRRVPTFGRDLKGYYHYQEEFDAILETLEVMDDLKKAGKIRAFGVSNETAYGVMRHVKEAETRDLPRVASIQNAYSLLNRTFEIGLAEVAMQEDVGLLAYSALAQGELSGKYLEGETPKGSRRDWFGKADRYQTPGKEKALRGYMQVARDFGLDPSAMAFQFVTTRPWVTSNIFGANGMDQLQTVFDSLSIEWTDELNDAVNDVHVSQPNPCP